MVIGAGTPARRLGAIASVALTLAAVAPADAADALSRVLAMPKASLLVEEGGREARSRQPDRPMIPASTMKIVTALRAIQRWGLDHRFRTDFHLTDDNWLWIEGRGDPYLVSEELDLVVATLKRQGLRSVAGVGTDDSLFAADVEIAGRSSSNNPYDAPVTALAVNFNTINVVRSRDGVRSAEAQTPLTPLARQLAQPLASGTHRINLQERELALHYAGELLAAKLSAAGIPVGGGLRTGRVPAGAAQIYRHHGSRDLRAVIESMLEYSNNFIANDLFLLLGDAGDGLPLDTAKAQRAADAWARKTFGWRDHRIEDGAGLSPGNRLSARQLLDAVKAFAPYQDLLPSQNGRVRAKTGTLSGVSCYAGFVQRNGGWEPFSLLINQLVPHALRLEVADALADGSGTRR
jgi:D-alanyl-D-alanine carboxypeptidase/D-alanyl-D-alanine-endopeptidase (penicillin-binding protein 4)